MKRLQPCDLVLGFVPLADCASLAVAKEKGLFAAEGLNVALSREPSWANIRDKVQLGLLDGAHMLGPMALASSLGAGGERVPVIAPLALNLNGSAVTVSVALAAEMRALDPASMAVRPRTAAPLRAVVERRRQDGQPPLVFAVVFPFSMHAYELRYWLADSGVDPDLDIRLVVAPPPRMASQLRAGQIDGFCVGAPWNTVSEAEGTGEIVIRATEIWPNGPDKVLGLALNWAERRPDIVQALLRSLIRAAAWADAPENRPELAAILARADYVGAPRDLLEHSLQDVVFHRDFAGFPWTSHAAWFVSQMVRWGQVAPGPGLASVAAGVYRPDLFRAAAADVGAATPSAQAKLVDPFLDGRSFDPADLEAYVAGFGIRRAPLAVAG